MLRYNLRPVRVPGWANGDERPDHRPPLLSVAGGGQLSRLLQHHGGVAVERQAQQGGG